MKTHLLLIMTPNMSLSGWSRTGQLSRELDIYARLCASLDLKLMIFSYGRSDQRYLPDGSEITLLEMPAWISARLPFRLQNLIYHLLCPLIFYPHFKKVALAKTNQFASAKLGLLLRLCFAIPLMVRMGYYHGHINPPSWMKALVEKSVFRLCQGILLTSIEAQGYLASRYGIKKEKMATILNSIDLQRFSPSTAKKEYDVIFVGRLAEVKNMNLLLCFLRATSLKVHIIGSGAYAKDIEQLSQARENISWSRRVDNAELCQYYNRSRAFLLISKYEGNPKSLLEAMACGVPCVGTDVPGIRECISQGQTGLLISPTLHSISAALEMLLTDKHLSSQISEKALIWAGQHCDMQTNIHAEVKFYKKLGYGFIQSEEQLKFKEKMIC